MKKLKRKQITLIVGGSGQFGISLSNYLLSQNFIVNITTRNKTKNINKFKKKVFLHNLNIYNKNKIDNIIHKIKPDYIFYFAGQSSPSKSFLKKKETYLSNYIGCKNFLSVLKKKNLNCKFINAASCEMYGEVRNHINLNSPKKPVSPYGISKVKAFNLTKKFRSEFKLKTYNAIIFNSESYLRPENYFIPKICLAALKAKKKNKKTKFGNLNISREWNWCDEQSRYLLQFVKKEPQDFILSNGKAFTAIQMIKFAFNYFKLDYAKYVSSDKIFYRKKDVDKKLSNYKSCLRRNNINRVDKIYGKSLIKKMIKYFIKTKRYK